MYICKKCHTMFEEPKIEYDDPSPAGVSLPSGRYQYIYCPTCGSDWIEDAKNCPTCGDWHVENGILCGECVNILTHELEQIRIKFNLTKDDFEEAIANNYGW